MSSRLPAPPPPTPNSQTPRGVLKGMLSVSQHHPGYQLPCPGALHSFPSLPAQEAAGRPLQELHCWRETEAGKGWDAAMLRDPDLVSHATPHPVAIPLQACTGRDMEKRDFALSSKKAGCIVPCLPALQQQPPAPQHPPTPSNSTGSPGPSSNPVLPSFPLIAFIST